MDKTTVSAILLAAGSSSRMGENKMLMRFCGKTPVELCVEAFCGIADEAVIAVSPDTEEIALTTANSAPYPVKIVRGGKTRQESVFNAVRAASGTIAAVHDCARCLVDRETIKASLRAAEQYGCGIASVPVTDTVRFGDTGETLDRSRLLAAQTPQSFRRDILLNAYSNAVGSFTDDADLCRSTGVQLHFSPGSKQNLKLTTRDDIPYFEFLLSKRSERNLPSGNVSAISAAEPRSGNSPALSATEKTPTALQPGESSSSAALKFRLNSDCLGIPMRTHLLMPRLMRSSARAHSATSGSIFPTVMKHFAAYQAFCLQKKPPHAFARQALKL